MYEEVGERKMKVERKEKDGFSTPRALQGRVDLAREIRDSRQGLNPW